MCPRSAGHQFQARHTPSVAPSSLPGVVGSQCLGHSSPSHAGALSATSVPCSWVSVCCFSSCARQWTSPFLLSASFSAVPTGFITLVRLRFRSPVCCLRPKMAGGRFCCIPAPHSAIPLPLVFSGPLPPQDSAPGYQSPEYLCEQ